MSSMMKFDINYLQKDIINLKYAIDYLRCTYVKKVAYFEEISKLLNDTNTAFLVRWNITYVKISSKHWPMIVWSVVFDWYSVPIVCYCGLNWATTKQARVDFYWSYFRLLELWYFESDHFLTYIKYISNEIPWITRLDWNIDFFYAEVVLIPRIGTIIKNTDWISKIRTNGKSKYYYWWWKTESWIYWSKSSKKTLIRLYDKLLDLKVKNKWFLYSDYLEYKCVLRLEWQFWPHFCKWFLLTDIDELLLKVKTFTWSHDNFSWFFYEKYPWLNWLWPIRKSWNYKEFLIRWKNLMKRGLNPFVVLDDLKDEKDYDLYLSQFLNDKLLEKDFNKDWCLAYNKVEITS